MRISDWSSDVCSSDLTPTLQAALTASVGLHSFAALRARLEEPLTWAHGVYVEVIDAPAPAAGETAATDELPPARAACPARRQDVAHRLHTHPCITGALPLEPFQPDPTPPAGRVSTT